MGYRVEEPEPGVLAMTFIGSVTVADRLKALDTVEEVARLNNPRSFLIDFGRASITAYGAADALMLAQRVARERNPFGRVAYVLRSDQTDMVAVVLTSLHGQAFFRRFEDSVAALAWLRDLSPAAEPLESDASE